MPEAPAGVKLRTEADAVNAFLEKGAPVRFHGTVALIVNFSQPVLLGVYQRRCRLPGALVRKECPR